MPILLESRDHLEELTHLKQVNAEFVSLVPHAANRIPFKILKTEHTNDQRKEDQMSLEVIHAIVQPSGKDVAALKGLYGEDWFNHVRLSDKIEDDGTITFVQKDEDDFDGAPFVLRDAGYGLTFKSGWLKKSCKGDEDILPIPTKNTKEMLSAPGDSDNNITVNVSVSVPIDGDDDENDNGDGNVSPGIQVSLIPSDETDQTDQTPDLPVFSEEFSEQTGALASAIAGIVEVVDDVDTKKKMIADLLSAYGTTLSSYMDDLAAGKMLIDEEDEDDTTDALMGKSEKADLSAPEAAKQLIGVVKKGVANLKSKNASIRSQMDDAITKSDISKNPKAIRACQDVKAALDTSDQSLDALVASLGNVTETELSKIDPAKAGVLNEALQHLRVINSEHGKIEKFDADEARDEMGRWTGSGSGGQSSGTIDKVKSWWHGSVFRGTIRQLQDERKYKITDAGNGKITLQNAKGNTVTAHPDKDGSITVSGEMKGKKKDIRGIKTGTELARAIDDLTYAANYHQQSVSEYEIAQRDKKLKKADPSFDEKSFMSDCMHDQEKVKGKPHDQCVAICLNMAEKKIPYSECTSKKLDEKFDESQPRGDNGQWVSGEGGQALNAAITGVAGGAAAGVASGLVQSPGGLKAAAAAASEARSMAGTALKIAGAVGVAGLTLSGVGIPIAIGATGGAALVGGLAAAGTGAAMVTGAGIGAVHYAPIYAKTVIADRLLNAAANAKREKAESSATDNTIEIGDVEMTKEEVQSMISEAVKTALATKTETETAPVPETTELTADAEKLKADETAAALKAELDKKEADLLAMKQEIEALKTKTESLQHSAGRRTSSAEVDTGDTKNQKRDSGAGPMEGFFTSL